MPLLLRLLTKVIGAQFGKHVGYGEASCLQIQRSLTPLTVLASTAVLNAGKRFGRQDTAVVTEPTNAREWAARIVLHLDDDPTKGLLGFRGKQPVITLV